MEPQKMEPQKKWLFEASNPNRSGWVSLFEVGEEQLQASHELRDQLNEINSPVVLRIVEKTPVQRFD